MTDHITDPSERAEFEQAAIDEYSIGNITQTEFVLRLARCGLNAKEIETAVNLYRPKGLFER